MTKKLKLMSFVTAGAIIPCAIYLKRSDKKTLVRELKPGGRAYRNLLFHCAHNGAYFCMKRGEYAIPVLKEPQGLEGTLWFTPDAKQPTVSFEPGRFSTRRDPPTKDADWHEGAGFVHGYLSMWWEKADPMMKNGGMPIFAQMNALQQLPWRDTFCQLRPMVDVKKGKDEDHLKIALPQVLVMMPDRSFLYLTANGPMMDIQVGVETMVAEMAMFPPAEAMRHLTAEDFREIPVASNA